LYLPLGPFFSFNLTLSTAKHPLDKYASTNYILLGAIVETVTGKPIAASYRSRFFDPLGLSSTYFPPQESNGDRGVLADPHENLSPFNPLLRQYGLPEFPDAYIEIAFSPFEGLASAAYAGWEYSAWVNFSFQNTYQ
jgi:CubicO group peptidase (beta-lactamase class C family)